MSRWKELPETLDERALRLTVELRRLKDRTGLSLVSLGRKTGYSRSSWERYLNGRALPPRRAVEQLARLGGADPTRLLVLHELAETAVRRARSTPVPDTAPATAGGSTTEPGAGGDPAAGTVPGGADGGPAGPPRARGSRRALRTPLLAGLAVAATAVAAVLIVSAPWEDDEPVVPRSAKDGATVPTARGHEGAYTLEPGRTYRCAVERGDDGLLSAGHSTTRDAVLQYSSTGWDVVEAQCLLRHHGFSPGGVDGIYGDLTARAVKRIQDRHGLVVDGKVGPHTWKVLRG
ncbi:peptidoglycan-binding protein [Streptomyces zingiberis]|uniref:Helix-turn-helix domain-containing protein n=1 Tax=Streptomyces zingiberis TaxID=2053010 RepID=A0ABX1BSH8_9ACTN|nr:peptidoglycan-binding protein [Streptomyces zingiberis]NJQ00677.1 helix-turn-helix domain-containing protein [Streptomyces zingiberis]